MSEFIKKLSGNEKGFTLIEILVVISIIALMSGVTANIINIRVQREKANDGIKASTVQKLVEALNAYRAVEGSYPADTDSNGNPKNDTNPVLNTYIENWPNGVPSGAVYTYVRSTATSMGIVVPAQFNNVFKYRSTSTWYSGVSPIGEVKLCSNSAGTTTAGNDLCPAANTR